MRGPDDRDQETDHNPDDQSEKRNDQCVFKPCHDELPTFIFQKIVLKLLTPIFKVAMPNPQSRRNNASS